MTFKGFLQLALEEKYLNELLTDGYGNVCYCNLIEVDDDGYDPQIEIRFKNKNSEEILFTSNNGNMPRAISFEEYTELKKKKNEKTI